METEIPRVTSLAAARRVARVIRLAAPRPTFSQRPLLEKRSNQRSRSASVMGLPDSWLPAAAWLNGASAAGTPMLRTIPSVAEARSSTGTFIVISSAGPMRLVGNEELRVASGLMRRITADQNARALPIVHATRVGGFMRQRRQGVA